MQSFANNVLTIRLNDGSSIRGTVTSNTEIECVAAGAMSTTHDDGDRGDGGRDHGGNDQAAEQNENDAAEGNETEAENMCSSSSLTPGAVVREAELRISSTGSSWGKVELGS